MNEERFTPEDFARWMALPEDHPERRARAGSPQFEAWRAMHESFVASEPADDAAGAAELAARLERTLGVSLSGAPREAVMPPRAVRAERGGWSLRALFSPALRPAFALAALAVVAASSWWAFERARTPDAVRGDAAFAIAEPRVTPDGVRLTWPAVPGADEYRVVLLGPDLAERGRIEGLREPAVTLNAAAIPGGVPAGGELRVEVTALRAGDEIATSRARTILLR